MASIKWIAMDAIMQIMSLFWLQPIMEPSCKMAIRDFVSFTKPHSEVIKKLQASPELNWPNLEKLRH